MITSMNTGMRIGGSAHGWRCMPDVRWVSFYILHNDFAQQEKKLQQAWMDLSGNVEWRDVPIEEMT